MRAPTLAPVSIELPLGAPPAKEAPARVRMRTVGAAAVLAAAVALLPFGGTFLLTLANAAAITGIAAMGLTVLIGNAGLLSLGQAGFLAIGGFTAALLVKYAGAGLLVCVAAGGACAAVVGMVVAAATARTAGIYLAVGTFALQYVVELVCSDVEVKLTSAVGFQMPAPSVFGIVVDTQRAWWLLLCACALGVWIVLRWLMRGHIGRCWISARENAAVATSLGISVIRCRLGAFALSSFVAGMAGALHGYYVGTVQIANYSLHLSIVYVTVVVLGGPGRLGGALWAAALVTALPYALSWALRGLGVDVISRGAGAESIALGLILALVLLRVPQRLLALARPKAT